jgi:citrate synthase
LTNQHEREEPPLKDVFISAAEAAGTLGVSRATLYAYVSRGLIRSQPLPGNSRERRYAREDVERLRARREERRDPGKAAARALHWGVPVLESAITLIADGKLYYRGHDAVVLARTRPFEQVASLIWTGDFLSDVTETQLHVVSGMQVEALPFIARAQSVLALVAARDPLAYDPRPRAVAQSGWRIVSLLTSVAASTPELAATVEETLAREWAPRDPRAAEVLRAALILSADHELNVSSFTARCVASAGSSPYAVVIAGLSAMEGRKHGGVSVRVESLLALLRRSRVRGSRAIRAALAERLRRGEPVEGFGHPLYPAGDPRAAALLSLLRERYPRSPELDFAREVARAAESLLGEKPSIDFALAAAARVLRLPAGAPLTLFAIGRTAGWIGHAIEQYAVEPTIRPRARYTGEVPKGD